MLRPDAHAQASYDVAFAWLLQDEGSVFSDDPADHGGATKYGITQGSLSAHLQRRATREEVAALTVEDARGFYLSQFWGPLRLGELDEQAAANALLSFAVLTGPWRAVRAAQEAVGVRADGLLGPKTVAAINSMPRGGFVVALATRMELFFAALVQADPHQARFLRGWLHRSHRLLAAATA